ncbi:LysR family transcriptional regulator [Pseudovibrio japonicus]|uniref:LysR family transcriptional regulator n=1 Tax=Pseudovibrio japonicus TaxID=366534 RepID=A0ABQ3ENI7_9HYPH|nr:LysR family transcriptional regulator [Pseudovibrio japonicus]GHB43594.1 LysR family transcriptional regulator [Pseudovibrio japonicus]
MTAELYRAMAIFAKVVDLGSFSAAARDLNVTRSAVSQQIQQLEDRIGTSLLNRTTRSLSLTEAGSELYQECTVIAEAADRGLQRVASLRDRLTGDLRISSPVNFGITKLIPALNDFMMQNCDLNVRLEFADDIRDMVQDRIDIAIRVGTLQDSAFIAQRLTPLDEVLCASPHYLEKNPAPTSVQQLEQHHFVLLSLLGEPQYLHYFDDKGELQRTRLRGRTITNSVAASIDLAKRGFGILHAQHYDIEQDLAQGTLVKVLDKLPIRSSNAYAVTLRRDNRPTKITRCIAHLVNYFTNEQRKNATM